MNIFIKAGALLGALLWMPAVLAVPYIPGDGGQVIERLPGRNDPLQRELNTLRAKRNAAPGDVQAAVVLARRYIDAGRVEGDPRYFGHAQAVLAPWWDAAEPDVRILRATLLQNRHQFEPALADLDRALALRPGDVQALLTRATVLQVIGRYDEAKQSCMKLFGKASELVTTTCIANVAGLNGQAAKSYVLLDATLKKNADAEPAVRAWSLTLLAEMASRLGRAEEAEKHFSEALRVAPGDSYLLGAYADFLLDRRRAPEAAALLKDHLRVDGLLLRYAEALKSLHSAGAAVHIDTLRARFDAARLRGDNVHCREEARFRLHLLGDAGAALKTAQANWDVQKEPADARILLEAAVAAGDAPSARPAIDWMRKMQWQDAALAPLLTRLGGGT